VDVSGAAHLEQINWVHHRVFLSRSQYPRGAAGRVRRRTAMPANAPASMFAEREKFGGSDS
jgi:hypothetical protein